MSSEIVFNKVGFEITFEELYDILKYITDEFPELIYDIENSDQSALICKDNNSFIVCFQQEGDLHSIPVLHYVEPKIFSLISDVNAQLGAYGLYIFDSEFGHSDCYYELVISKKGHKPKQLAVRNWKMVTRGDEGKFGNGEFIGTRLTAENLSKWIKLKRVKDI